MRMEHMNMFTVLKGLTSIMRNLLTDKSPLKITGAIDI